MIELKLVGAALCWVAAFWIRSKISQEKLFDLSTHIAQKPEMAIPCAREVSPDEAMKRAARAALAVAERQLRYAPVQLDHAFVQQAVVEDCWLNRLDEGGYVTDAYYQRYVRVYVVIFVTELGPAFETCEYLVKDDLRVYQQYDYSNGGPHFLPLGGPHYQPLGPVDEVDLTETV